MSSLNPPINITIIHLDLDNAVISWNAPISGITPSSYSIVCIVSDGSKAFNFDTTNYAFKLRDLIISTTYIVYLTSEANGKSSSPSNTLVFTTLGLNGLSLSPKITPLSVKTFDASVISTCIKDLQSLGGGSIQLNPGIYNIQPGNPIADITGSCISISGTVANAPINTSFNANGIFPSPYGCLINVPSGGYGLRFGTIDQSASGPLSKTTVWVNLKEIGFCGTIIPPASPNPAIFPNRRTTNPTSYQTDCGIHITGRLDQCNLSRKSFTSLYCGIYLDTTANLDACHFNRLNTDGCGHGIVIKGTCDAMDLTNCILSDTYYYGLFASPSSVTSTTAPRQTVNINGGTFARCHGSPTATEGQAAAVHFGFSMSSMSGFNIQYSGCGVFLTGSPPNYTLGGSSTTVTNSSTVGLFVTGSLNTFSGAMFWNNGNTQLLVSGGSSTMQCNQNLYTGMRFLYKNGYGIDFMCGDTIPTFSGYSVVICCLFNGGGVALTNGTPLGGGIRFRDASSATAGCGLSNCMVIGNFFLALPVGVYIGANDTNILVPPNIYFQNTLDVQIAAGATNCAVSLMVGMKVQDNGTNTTFFNSQLIGLSLVTITGTSSTRILS